MKAFVAGVVVTILCIVGGGYFYLSRGYAPVATDARPLPFERRITGMALHAKLRKEMPTKVPIEATEANYVAGAHLYMTHCAVCHGAPGQPKTAIALGEFPVPPQLMHGKGVTDDPPGESYWKVANGIRLTGMPGFHQSLSETQMWQVSLLVANANKLPDSAMRVLSGQAEAPAQTPPPSPGH